MTIKFLDGKKFYKAFLNGASLVEENKSHLNEINFFPVPDNDTGNNMSYTLLTTAAQVEPDNSIYNTLESISNYIVRSARGNSGLIMAQFFNGLYKKMTKTSKLTTEDFARNVEEAIPYLYNNVSEPTEGTMLTVIKDWSERLPEIAENIDDFIVLFDQSLETARESLEQTKYQLQVNRESDTVDAGGQGFVYFLEGVLDYWNNKDQKLSAEDIPEGINKHDPSGVDSSKTDREEPVYRYCTEVLMLGNIEVEKTKALLKDKGDSLLVASSDNNSRVHIHTNNPAEIVYLLRNEGKILEQKVDDMLQQIKTSRAEQGETAVVTDSIADIPRDILDEYNIHSIPLNILIDGTNFLDKLTINPEYFYEYLEEAEDFPSSSQPGIDFIYDYLLEVAENYDSILMISVSEELSGTGEAFKQAKSRLETEKDIEFNYINSKLNSGAQGLLVMKAAEELAEGKDLSEVEKSIKNYREKSQIFVNVNDFDYMIRGGRVSPMKGFMARLLNFKPIISLDQEGDGNIKGKAITNRGVRKKIKKYVKEIAEENNIEKYAIVHARAPELVEKWKKEMEKMLGFPPAYTMHVSSITALNSGPGTVGLSFLVGE